MKKIYLFLLALVCSIASWAADFTPTSEEQAYTLKLAGTSLYLNFGTSGNATLSATATEVYFEGSGTSYTLKNADGYYLYAARKSVTASSSSLSWTIAESTNGYTLYKSSGQTGYLSYSSATESSTFTYGSGTTAEFFIEAVSVTPVVPTKDDLQDAINTAKALDTTGTWSYDATTVQNLIDAAQAVYDNADATDEEIANAITTLNEGIDALTPTLKSGRYFVQNYTTFTSDGETENPYLANHYNLMGVGSAMVSYYSIWDVTNLGDGTYTMQNEGQRYLGIPKDLSNTDGGYLGYQADETGLLTHIGCFTDGNATSYTLDIIPNQFGIDSEYAGIQIHNAVNGKNYAAYLDVFARGASVGKDNVDTNAASNDVMASTLTSVADTTVATVKQAFLWKFVPVTAEAELNMFNDQIDHSLVGYVGGVASIDPQAARKEQRERGEWLATINYDISAAKTRLGQNPDCSAAQDGTVGAISYMKDIFQQTLANRTGDTPSPLHIKLSTSEYFFFENMHGSRPCTYSRLHVDSNTFSADDTTITPYTTVDPSSIADDAKTEYMWYIEGDESGYKAYTTSTSGNTYLNTTATDGHLFLDSKATSNPLTFVIEEITPSIYVIKDAAYTGTDGKCYITVEGADHLVHYNYIELSTLWKFETITTTDITLNLDPEDTESYREGLFNADGTDASAAVDDYTNAKKYNGGFIDNYGQTIKSTDTAYGAKYQCYGTYCPAIDMMIRDNKGYKAYYVSAVSSNGTITLKPVTYESTKDGTYNAQYLSAGTGYILISDQTDAERTSFTGEIAFSDKTTAVTAPEANLLTGILDAKTAEDKTTAVLSYVETGSTALGNDANGNQAYGVGIGFYNLAVGKTLAAGKAYIDLNTVAVEPGNNSDVAFKYESNGVAAMKFLIEDENGEETGIAELNADGTMTVQPTAIFDLSGRRVSKAQKGIYIVNGKKIMY